MIDYANFDEFFEGDEDGDRDQKNEPRPSRDWPGFSLEEQFKLQTFLIQAQQAYWRTWQRWRSIADCPPRAQKISRLSAIKLWVLAMSGGTAEARLTQSVMFLLKNHGDKLSEWLRVTSWQVSGVESMMRSINSVDAEIDVIHRQRLYEWSEKAGLSFSVKRDYSHSQVARVANAARRGVGRGRPRCA